MARGSSDFERFLYANFPEDYRQATVDDVADDVVYAILMRHEARYKIWQEIPEWIKNQYHDKLPNEVLDGNITVKDFVSQEVETKKEEEKTTAALLEYSAVLLAAGYAAETVAVLAENKRVREQILEQAGGEKLSEEQFAQWLCSRQSDRNAIVNDWRTHQPEKYMLHLIKEVDRAKKRGQKASNEEEKASYGMKASALEQEFFRYAGKFKSKENRMALAAYLKEMPQQAALSHLGQESLALFSRVMGDCGILVTPKGDKTALHDQMGRENLMAELKGNFLRRKNAEGILTSKYLEPNETFERVRLKDVLDKQQDGGMDGIILRKMRNNNLHQA